jgi:acetylglutamate kinase
VKPIVVKLGGNALQALPDAVTLAGPRPLVLIHGGGAQITTLMRRRGIEPRFVHGRRVTDLPTLACVRTALATVSDELVAALDMLGVAARAFRSGELITATAEPGLGLVGRVEGVATGPITQAWQAGATPLVAPLGLDHASRFLNINADDVAAALAGALDAGDLVFLSDVPGVLDADGRVLETISASQPPSVTGGMLPKLQACAAAIAAGVDRVRIGTETVVGA